MTFAYFRYFISIDSERYHSYLHVSRWSLDLRHLYDKMVDAQYHYYIVSNEAIKYARKGINVLL